MKALLLCAFWLCAATHAAAQGPNGVFLIAKPGLTDPNFRETVVLVTQAEDFSTVGVIINRPTALKLAQILPDDFDTGNYADAVYSGGPVMRQALVAVFESDAAPVAAAFHVLRNLYMSMHPENLRRLLTAGDRRYRIYAGFAGWAPRQLESEFNREGWFALPADEDMVFRQDTSGLWQELLERAQRQKTRARP